MTLYPIGWSLDFLVEGSRVIEPNSKGAVQRFNKSFELLEPLREKAHKILAVLSADGVASEKVKIANRVKSNMSYWKDRFIKAGALRLKVDGKNQRHSLKKYGTVTSASTTGDDGRNSPLESQLQATPTL